MLEQLLNQHQYMLTGKNIRTKQDLFRIIQLDLDKIVWAISSLKNQTTFQLLSNFFAESETTRSYLLPKIDSDYLYHIGFEIYEPLAMVLDGFEHWLEQHNRFHTHQAKISQVIRFPASQSLQKRVDAFVEIMRIWLEVADRQQLMLELFDIHHPIQRLYVSTSKYRNLFEDLHSSSILEMPHEILIHDEIWHYAILVDQANDVLDLHQYFQSLVQENQVYHLPFAEIVNNKRDGSFYTKIINRNQGVELEFVAEGQF